MVLLNLSAAFDTVDHSMLLDVLHERFGVDDGALKWFESYLRVRTNVYSTESGISLPVALACGVLQGSVMGPMEFIAYTEENVANIDNKTINHHLYADDIQLLAKMQIANVLPLPIKCELKKTVSKQHCWCSSKRLCLNPVNTELAWFSSTSKRTAPNC